MTENRSEKLIESGKTLLTEGLLNIQFEKGLKKIRDAIKILSECIEMDPDNPDIIKSLRFHGSQRFEKCPG